MRTLLAAVLWAAIIQGSLAYYYKIEGHLASIEPHHVKGILKNRGAYFGHEDAVSQRLNVHLGGQVEEFFISEFQIHENEYRSSAIFHAHLTTTLTREELVYAVKESQELFIFHITETYSLPAAPSLLTGNDASVISCNNGGILLPNATCVCPSFYAGDQCEIVQCLHHGIQDGNRCACPPGVYAINCESRGCLPGVQDNMDVSKQTFILVVNQKSTMDYVMNYIVTQVSGLISDINRAQPGLITNFILTSYCDGATFHYMDTYGTQSESDFLNRLANVNLVVGSDEQPTTQAIVQTQKTYPLMRSFSNVFIFADSVDSQSTSSNFSFSSNNIEEKAIEVTKGWRNRLVLVLSQRSGTYIDTYGNYYDIFRRVIKATLGDLIIISPNEIQKVLDPFFTYYRQNENVAVRYGSVLNQVIPIVGDTDQQFVYGLITVEPNGTLPTITNQNGEALQIEVQGNKFMLIRTYHTITTQLNITGGSRWSCRVWVESGNTAIVSYATDPLVDVGSGSCMAELLPFATAAQIGFTNTATLEWIDLGTGDSLAAPIPSGTRNAECTFPMLFQNRSQPCTPGAFGNKFMLGGAIRIVPGYCGVLDHHDPIPFTCFNGGSRAGPNSCKCAPNWTGRNCGAPRCSNGGVPNQFPGNNMKQCACPFGYGGDFCEILSCTRQISQDNFDYTNRSIALVVQSSMSQVAYSTSINNGLNSLFQVLKAGDSFTEFVLTSFNTITQDDDPHSLLNTTTYSSSSDFQMAFKTNVKYLASSATSLDSLTALYNTIMTVTNDKSAIFLFVDKIQQNEPGYQRDVILLAAERQLEINIVITPPFNMSDGCMSKADAATYTDIAVKTGGNIINLCNTYGYYSNDPIVQLFAGYGNTHHHVETVNEDVRNDCSSVFDFYIDDLAADIFIFVNGDVTENFTVSYTSSSQTAGASPNLITNMPFLSVYKLIPSINDDAGYTLTVTPGTGATVGFCSIRVVEKTNVSISVGFSPDPSMDAFARTLFYATPAHVVLHVSQPQMNTTAVTSEIITGNDTIISYSGAMMRDTNCRYEYFITGDITCGSPFDYFIVLSSVFYNNKMLQRTQRAYCYVGQGQCLNGGLYTDDGVCVCPDEFSGTYCENPVCQNGQPEGQRFTCECNSQYTGRLCEYGSCHNWDFLATADVRQQEFKQITFVLNVNRDQLFTNIQLNQAMPAFIAESESTNIPKQYSLITFDDQTVTNVVSTSHSDQFLTIFNATVQKFNPTIATMTLGLQAVSEAFKINIQPPEIIYLFTGTTTAQSSSVYNSVLRQRIGTQVNVIYTPQTVDYPQPPSGKYDYQLNTIARQSGGRILPANTYSLSGIDKYLASTIKENALIFDDAAKDCTAGKAFTFYVESTFTTLIIDVTGQGVASAVTVTDGQGNKMLLSDANVLYTGNSGIVYKIDSSAVTAKGGDWSVNITTTAGSCYMQARAITPLHVIPGLTSDNQMDFVESSMFTGFGTNRSAFMTFRIVDSNGKNYKVSLTNLNILASDFDKPWQNNQLLQDLNLLPRDPINCANTFVSDEWIVDTTSYQKFILYGKDPLGKTFQRTFFFSLPNTKDNALTCQSGGTRNLYGECICDDYHTGDYCTDRRCQNGGSPSYGICVCTDGYYGDYCQQYIPNTPSGPTSSPPSTMSQPVTTKASGPQTTAAAGPSTQTGPATTGGPQTTVTAGVPTTVTVGVPTTVIAGMPTTMASGPQTTMAAQTTQQAMMTTMVPTSPTTEPAGPSGPCDPVSTNYDVVWFVDLSGIDPDFGNSIPSEQSLMELVGQMIGLGGTITKSRYVLNGVAAGSENIGNVTNTTAIGPALTAAQVQISYPINILNLATAINQFAVAGWQFDPNTESPPIAVLMASRESNEGTAGLQAAVNNLKAKGYKMIGIDLSAGTAQGVLPDFQTTLGMINSYAFDNVAATANWVVGRLCNYKS